MGPWLRKDPACALAFRALHHAVVCVGRRSLRPFRLALSLLADLACRSRTAAWRHCGKGSSVLSGLICRWRHPLSVAGRRSPIGGSAWRSFWKRLAKASFFAAARIHVPRQRARCAAAEFIFWLCRPFISVREASSKSAGVKAAGSLGVALPLERGRKKEEKNAVYTLQHNGLFGEDAVIDYFLLESCNHLK